ncbi:PfkB family carbohydrate kinase [Microbacterium sp. M3]|uniref:PfkB family carbohydrate kinase n=1 Tax=Microbacterium arthrosphaerae TaxID=792652 RepID=A0ABU4GXD2_9MICO|nr:MULTISPECIES: PfkB family carbohydrate kinase [Microbacterium]MDW4571741.1 PfkB family carbohydrate kinase [Microbacterium arthrosphaerae]MDW7605596.1 PfkB family carbohydrate kinase [Microbacterium sp. M3]
MSVVVVGDALIDELRDDHGVREFVGGAALNVAVGLARLGVPATLVAMLGDDEPASRVRRYLADFGVQLIATPSLLGTARAVSTRTGGGEPTYEFNEASQQRRIRFGEAERQAMTDAAAIVVSCFACDDPEQTAELVEAMAAARERAQGEGRHAALFAIDPNPRTGMMRDREEFVRGFERLAGGAALVKVGEDDAGLLYDDRLDVLRARLIDLGADAVLATEGAAGATIEAGEIVVTRPVSDLPGRIVDTMGAGDAAFAATVAALLEGAPKTADGWETVLQTAMDAAAATCRFEGALLRTPSALTGLDLDSIGT